MISVEDNRRICDQLDGSGWSAELTESERAVVEDRAPEETSTRRS